MNVYYAREFMLVFKNFKRRWLTSGSTVHAKKNVTMEKVIRFNLTFDWLFYSENISSKITGMSLLVSIIVTNKQIQTPIEKYIDKNQNTSLKHLKWYWFSEIQFLYACDCRFFHKNIFFYDTHCQLRVAFVLSKTNFI